MNQIVVICICIFAFIYTSSAQQQLTKFDDQFGIKGEIRHTGILYDSILPQNGRLDIRWREVSGNDIHTYQVIGQTKEHLPTGIWSWEEALWDYNIVVGQHTQPIFNTYGTRKKWAGAFKNGIPEGKWSFTIDSIGENGKIIKNLSKIQINYKDGICIGQFFLESNLKGNALKLNGRLGNNGIATGTWSYQYFRNGQLVKEERVYEKGLLKNVTLIEGSTKNNISIEHNVNFLNNSQSGLSINNRQIGGHRFQEDEYVTLGSQLVSEIFSHQFQNGWELEVFPFDVHFSIPEFYKLEYPLSEADIRDINESHELISKQRKEIELHLSGNIYIHRSRSGILDTSISYLQLQDQRLQTIDSLLKRVEHPLFTYKNRFQQGLQNWFKSINELRTTRGEVYDSLEVIIPLVIVPDFAPNIFREVKDLLLQNEVLFPDYFATIDEAKSNLRREGQLKALEDIMMARFESLQTFYGGKSGIASDINIKWLKGDVQELLQAYANTSNYDSAMQIGNSITQYLDSLESWQYKIETFDNMAKVLREQYSYMVYNPYNGTNDIEVVVKRRFLNNILNHMLPYMSNEMNRETNWEKWSQYWNRQFAIYNFLLAFISKEDKQSKRIENRIRRESKPDKMLKTILNFIEE